MLCAKCGTEILEDAQFLYSIEYFCPKCGFSVKSITVDYKNSSERKRHGFTSFWLIFGMILNIIGCVFFLLLGIVVMVSPEVKQELTNISRLDILYVFLYVIIGFIYIISYILLLRWKKIGFWIYIGCTVFIILLNMQNGVRITLLPYLINIAILWGVLHIRKNGYSTWYFLSAKFDESNYKNESSADIEQKEYFNNFKDLSKKIKICRRCNSEVSIDLFICPSCKFAEFY